MTLIADTNVLLRSLDGEQTAHSRAARARVQRARLGPPIAVLAATVLEVAYVLESSAAGYRWPRDVVASAVEAIVNDPGFEVEHGQALHAAASRYRDHAYRKVDPSGNVGRQPAEMDVSFDHVFRDATGYEPYDYQRALGARAGPPSVIEVPTGSGKTMAALIPWLCDQTAPRRLACAMPMRSPVEQTALDRCLRGEPAPVPGGVMQAMAPVNCRARVALSGTLQTIRCVTAQPTAGAPPASLDRPCRHAPTASISAACG